MTRLLLSAGAAAMQGARRHRNALPSLDVLAPHLLLDERGQTITTGISSWANQGSAGGAAVQGTAANQPAQTTINGFACPNFDGTNDSLSTSGIASDYVTASEYEGFAVFRIASLAAGTPAAPTSWYSDRSIFQCASSASFGLVSSRYGGAVGRGSGGSWNRGLFLPAYNDGAQHVVAFRLVGGSLIYSIDGGPERTTASANISPITGVLNIGANFGGSALFAGPIACLFLRKTVLTTEERTQAIAYLATKYSVPIVGKQVDLAFSGDSIVLQDGSAQYRHEMWDLTGPDYGLRLTGALRPAAPSWPQNMVAAGNGYTVSSLRTLYTTSGLGTYWGADIHWVCIGTNDLANGADCATLRTRWLLLASDFRTFQPNALVVMSLIMPREEDTGGAVAKVAEWNADWAEPVMNECIALGNRMVLSTAMTLPGVTRPDGLHPADTVSNAQILGGGLASEYPDWRTAA